MKLIVYPSAFNTTTGPLHWSLLARARAVDTESFVVMASPARSTDASDYQAWGHSMIVSPYGEVLGELDEGEDMLIQDIDIEKSNRMRAEIPLFKQKRTDIYKI
jgi:omega-amidase